MSYSFTNDWVHDLDRWLTTDPRDEEDPIITCSNCGEGIYEGETYYKVAGNAYCTDCIDDMREIAEMEEDEE